MTVQTGTVPAKELFKATENTKFKTKACRSRSHRGLISGESAAKGSSFCIRNYLL